MIDRQICWCIALLFWTNIPQLKIYNRYLRVRIHLVYSYLAVQESFCHWQSFSYYYMVSYHETVRTVHNSLVGNNTLMVYSHKGETVTGTETWTGARTMADNMSQPMYLLRCHVKASTQYHITICSRSRHYPGSVRCVYTINVISRKYSPYKLWQLFCSIL